MGTYARKKKVGASVIRLIIRFFWKHMRRYPLTTAVVIISCITIQLFVLAIPWYFKEFLDTVSSSQLPMEETAQNLGILLKFIALLMVLRWIFQRIWGFANIHFEASIMRDLQDTAFRGLSGHSYRFFTSNFSGALAQKVNRLSPAFETIADQIEENLLPLLVTVVCVITILFHRDILLGTLLLCWTIFFVAVFYAVALWKVQYDRESAAKDTRTKAVLADAITNIITTKLFSRQTYEETRYRAALDEHKRIRMFCWNIGATADALQGACMVIIELALFWTWIYLWQHGRATIGDILLIQGLLAILLQKIWGFGYVIRRIYEALANTTEMIEILHTPYEVEDMPNAECLRVEKGTIEFKSVSFGFHEGRNVLEQFSLLIHQGEKIALVGPTGAGKSTVISLLLRLHNIEEGEILIDGKNVAAVTQESLRRHIAVVPQEPILFHRTLKENIRYGRLEAGDNEIIAAARKAHCHEFISHLPKSYDTYVGERGIQLSGGERQRVAIARAILAATPILVLDEATSSLDSETEMLIQDALKNLMRDKTAIVIAHRLSTIMQMNRIVVIENGRIAEMGTHEKLLHSNGIYKRLWSLQAERFIE